MRDSFLGFLRSFKKKELEDLRSYFGAHIPSSLRKEEFAREFADFIFDCPQVWLEMMLERDLRLLRQILDQDPGMPLSIAYSDYPSILELVGLVDFDDSDPDFQRVWISDELRGAISPVIDAVIEDHEKCGVFELERAALGYLNLYGVLEFDEFLKMICDYGQHLSGLDFDRFNFLLLESPVLKLCRCVRDGCDYLCSPLVLDIDQVLDRRAEFADLAKTPKSFTPEEAVKAGTGSPFFAFGLETKEGKDFVQMLLRLGYQGDELLQQEHDVWISSQMVEQDADTMEIFSAVMSMEDSMSNEEFDDCMRTIASYANSLPKWALSGNSSDDLGCMKVVFQTDDDSQWDDLRKENPLLRFFVPPAPADAPCPCGSGLSYRLCHGKLKN